MGNYLRYHYIIGFFINDTIVLLTFHYDTLKLIISICDILLFKKYFKKIQKLRNVIVYCILFDIMKTTYKYHFKTNIIDF